MHPVNRKRIIWDASGWRTTAQLRCTIRPDAGTAAGVRVVHYTGTVFVDGDEPTTHASSDDDITGGGHSR